MIGRLGAIAVGVCVGFVAGAVSLLELADRDAEFRARLLGCDLCKGGDNYVAKRRLSDGELRDCCSLKLRKGRLAVDADRVCDENLYDSVEILSELAHSASDLADRVAQLRDVFATDPAPAPVARAVPFAEVSSDALDGQQDASDGARDCTELLDLARHDDSKSSMGGTSKDGAAGAGDEPAAPSAWVGSSLTEMPPLSAPRLARCGICGLFLWLRPVARESLPEAIEEFKRQCAEHDVAHTGAEQ